jgi:CAAX protease family protein
MLDTDDRPIPGSRSLTQIQPTELVVAVGLFIFALVEFLRVIDAPGSVASHASATALFVLLVGSYLGLSIEPVRRALRGAVSTGFARQAAGPFILLTLIAVYSETTGSPAISLVLYAVYLFLPLVILTQRHPSHRPARQLAAALFLWLPITFGLPRLRLGEAYDATHLVAMVMGLYCFLILEPVEGIGYTFQFRRRDWGSASVAAAVYLAVAVPIGFSTDFVVWHPRLTAATLMVEPLHIYLWIAVPEELLFRGIIQNLCVRWLGIWRGLAVAAIVFGLAHLPDLRYVFLATLAGLAYGWVYWRTERITASALTHAAVDWVWKLVFQR